MKRRRFPLVWLIILSMVLGAVVGQLLGERARPLGEFGTVIIGFIKALAGPLLMFAVLDAFLRTQVRLRSGLLMIAIALTNAVFALAIGLTISNLFRPGLHLTNQVDPAAAPTAPRKLDFVKEVVGFIPTSLVQPFLDNSIITIVILSVLGGIALRRVKDEKVARGESDYRVVEDFVATVYRTIEVMLGMVVALVPLAVFGVVARTIGHDGFRPLVGLAAYVLATVLGLAVQIVIVYQFWLIVIARLPLGWFWRGAREAVVYALGASSSLATLPVTLRCLDRMNVSRRSARMAACVGTNLNNDGILLYEAMAVLFVAQANGIHLSFEQQLLAAASCALAGIGIAGIPDAGLISLALVLGTVGLPLEILPLLLTVDWLLSRCRAATNVISDILVAVLLDRFDRGADDADQGSTASGESGGNTDAMIEVR